MEIYSIIFESPAHNIFHLKNMITLTISGKPDLQRPSDLQVHKSRNHYCNSECPTKDV
jgi:hypothetical protein